MYARKAQAQQQSRQRGGPDTDGTSTSLAYGIGLEGMRAGRAQTQQKIDIKRGPRRRKNHHKRRRQRQICKRGSPRTEGMHARKAQAQQQSIQREGPDTDGTSTSLAYGIGWKDKD